MGENNIGKGLTKQDLDLKGWINFLNVWTIKAELFFFCNSNFCNSNFCRDRNFVRENSDEIKISKI